MQMIANSLPIPSPGPARQVVMSGFALNIGTGLQEIVVPFFLIGFCGATVGDVGLVLTVVALGAILAVLPAGYLCDRLPAGRVIVIAGATQALATLVLTVSTSVMVVGCVLAFCTIMAQVARIARNTITISLSPETRTIVRAQMSVWSNLGVGIGMGLTVLLLGVGEKWAYNLGFAVTACCFLASALLRRNLLPKTATLDGTPAQSTFVMAMTAVRNPKQGAIGLLHCGIFFHQMFLTVGVSLWVAADPNLPNWLAGLTLVVNLLIAVVLQGFVAKRIATPGDALKAWSISAAISGIAVAIFGLGSTGNFPTWIAITVVMIGIVLLSMAELWYVAGELEISVLYATEHSQGTSQAIYLLGRDLGTVIGPIALAALIATREWMPWLVTVMVFASIAIVLQRMHFSLTNKSGDVEGPHHQMS